jgi:transcriptional regulator GlxA family with amidase domain
MSSTLMPSLSTILYPARSSLVMISFVPMVDPAPRVDHSTLGRPRKSQPRSPLPNVHDEPADSGSGLAATVDWLGANLYERLTVESIAANAGTSVHSLTGHVQEQVGIIPMQQLLRMRVQRAPELLETTDTPLKASAAPLGGQV